ncbi:hypothetical protein SynBIOSE41_03948 [Synechococcus sp. BIOS-E4-1]|nr:hypothetical protein SynBIOSE41_03948 [Synechococcus sp. BIOS-E4-1]
MEGSNGECCWGSRTGIADGVVDEAWLPLIGCGWILSLLIKAPATAGAFYFFNHPK